MINIEDKNEHIMIELRNKLDMDFFNILGYDPEYKFHGNKKSRGYCFYITNKLSKKDSIYNISFCFKIYYEDTYDILRRYEKTNDTEHLSDDDLEAILKYIQDIKYASIEALYINPTRTGLGSKIVQSLIARLGETGKIEKIFLEAASLGSAKFWNRHGFVDIIDYEDIDVTISGLFNKVYKYNNKRTV